MASDIKDMLMSKLALRLGILVCASLCLPVTQAEMDQTLQPNANGSAVVHAVITKIDTYLSVPACEGRAGSIESNHRLLRRIAFVETEDGATGVPAGGIWAIKEEHFNLIVSSIHDMNNYCISPKLDIDINYDKTNLPLLSGLAAHLYLQKISTKIPIPLAENIAGQALFWFNNYTTKDPGVCDCALAAKRRFRKAVEELARRERCRVNADIFFVLDMSHSITLEDLELVRTFMLRFVTDMQIGPTATQIGTIVFGTEAHILFYLNTYSSSDDLVNATRNITFDTSLQATSTPDGLCKLIRHGLTEEHGYRRNSATVFKIAIVMSDGKSNVRSSECGWKIVQAARAVHNLNPQVLVYAIGIGDFNDVKELQLIATDESHYAYITEFNSLPEVQEFYEDDICRRVTIRYEEGELIDGTLSKGEIVRYNLPLSVFGTTIQVCVKSGKMAIYGSVTYHDPNSALNDFSLEFIINDHCKDCMDCQELFINSTSHQRAPENSRSNWLKRSNEPPVTTTVYMTFRGMADTTHFVMNSTEGDVTSDNDSNNKYSANASDSEKNTVVVALSSSGVVLLVLSCILVIACVYGCTMRRRKKKQVEETEDECGLLSVDYVEM